jgi:hypothetical protein
LVAISNAQDSFYLKAGLNINHKYQYVSMEQTLFVHILAGCMGLECEVVQSRCVAGIGREMRKLQKCEEVYRSKRMSSWEYLYINNYR